MPRVQKSLPHVVVLYPCVLCTDFLLLVSVNLHNDAYCRDLMTV